MPSSQYSPKKTNLDITKFMKEYPETIAIWKSLTRIKNVPITLSTTTFVKKYLVKSITLMTSTVLLDLKPEVTKKSNSKIEKIGFFCVKVNTSPKQISFTFKDEDLSSEEITGTIKLC